MFCDLSLKSVSVRDLAELTSDLQNVLRTYKKFGKSRTMKDDKHLNKHAMHLVRLLLTGSELLETGKVNTYRGKDRDLLMSIRMGEYMAEDGTYKQEFYDDLVTARENGWNLIMEKYARMMQSTNPLGYARLEKDLPAKIEKTLEKELQKIFSKR